MEAYSREKTLSVYMNQLEQRVKSDHSGTTPEMVISKLEQADPSIKKAYVLPLLKWYLEGSMRYLEDASKATSGLTLYGKFRNRNLPSLNTLSFSQFLDLSDELSDTKSSRELDKEEELEFYKSNQAEIFYEDNQYKIIIPRSKEAAIYFGRGTRWCTSADNDNRFEYYNNKGYLYIILFKGIDTRWQFHFEERQFMNEQDEELSREEIMATGLPEIFEKISEESLSLFLLRNPSEEVQRLAVQKNGYAIQLIDNPSVEVQKLAVQEDGYSIQFIDNPSEEVQKIAVQENGFAIELIDNPSVEVQRLAVQKNGYAIFYIKNPSVEVQKLAVREDGYSIQFIDNPSEEIQRLAVQQNGYAIRYIDNPSEEIQRLAVQELKRLAI